MFTQMQHEGWTFSLDVRNVLTISGHGRTLNHKHECMSPNELKGFAQGWAAMYAHMTRDNDMIAAPTPQFQ